MKIIFFGGFMLGVAFTTFAQNGLKGYELGQNYSDDEQVMTTLGGIDGVIFIGTLKDSRIYSLIFMPSTDGQTVNRVHESDVTRMVNGLSSKFNVKMRFTPKDTYSNDEGWHRGSVDDTQIMVSQECNEYMDTPCEMTVYVYSKHLNDIADKEKQEEANTDF